MAHVKIKTPLDWVDLTVVPTVSPAAGEKTLFFLNGVLSSMDDAGAVTPVGAGKRAEVALATTDFTDGVATIDAGDIPFAYDHPEITVYDADGNLIQVGVSVDGTSKDISISMTVPENITVAIGA
jgi:hypothetical protein